LVKSLAELAELRKKAQEMTRLREGDAPLKVVVGMGTCGIAAGARDTMAAILDELAQHNRDDVTVTQTGCAGRCEMEPLVEVCEPGQPKVTYGKVTPERARRIVAEHIGSGRIIEEWVVAKQ
jgi:NADP-reducing hydrogenase subunit HndB